MPSLHSWLNSLCNILYGVTLVSFRFCFWNILDFSQYLFLENILTASQVYVSLSSRAMWNSLTARRTGLIFFFFIPEGELKIFLFQVIAGQMSLRYNSQSSLYPCKQLKQFQELTMAKQTVI